MNGPREWGWSLWNSGQISDANSIPTHEVTATGLDVHVGMGMWFQRRGHQVTSCIPLNYSNDNKNQWKQSHFCRAFHLPISNLRLHGYAQLTLSWHGLSKICISLLSPLSSRKLMSLVSNVCTSFNVLRLTCHLWLYTHRHKCVSDVACCFFFPKIEKFRKPKIT